MIDAQQKTCCEVATRVQQAQIRGPEVMASDITCCVTHSHTRCAGLESVSAQMPSRQRLAKPKSQANFNSLASPGVRRMSSGQTTASLPSSGLARQAQAVFGHEPCGCTVFTSGRGPASLTDTAPAAAGDAFEAALKVGPPASSSPASPASHHLANPDAGSPQSVQVRPLSLHGTLQAWVWGPQHQVLVIPKF